MKVGDISQTVWKRSMQKQLNTEAEEILYAPTLTESCNVYETGENYVSVSAQAQSFGRARETGIYAVAMAMNDLYCHRAEVLGVNLRFTSTYLISETQLKNMVAEVKTFLEGTDVPLTGVTFEINPAVSQVIISAEAFGRVKKEDYLVSKEAAAGQDIVLCGYIGLEGMLRILGEREEELKERFVPSFIRQIKDLKKYLLMAAPLQAAKDVKITAATQIKKGGILAALWNLAEASETGLEVELSKMSIRQETVEICECYNLNPYQMTSTGCFLFVTPEGDKLVKALKGAGARATMLGVTTADNARVITSGEERRYLDRPAPDELMLWWQKVLS